MMLPSGELDSPTADLRSIDAELWDIKNAIRGAASGTATSAFAFIELAHSIYRTNDRRAPVRRRDQQAAGLGDRRTRNLRAFPASLRLVPQLARKGSPLGMEIGVPFRVFRAFRG